MHETWTAPVGSHFDNVGGPFVADAACSTVRPDEPDNQATRTVLRVQPNAFGVMMDNAVSPARHRSTRG